MKFFVLEDNIERIKFFKKIFHNNNVIFCTTVKNAKEVIGNMKFDIIFLDHDLNNEVHIDSREEETGAGLVRYIIKENLHKDATYIIHSQNHVGAAYMLNILVENGRKVFLKPFTTIYCGGEMEILKTLEKNKKYEPYKIDMVEDLVVCISQHKAVNYTVAAIKALKQDKIPFTSIILFDGTEPNDLTEEVGNVTDIMLYIRKKIISRPHIWNVLYGVAKLTRAKYMLWQDCDVEMKKGSLISMFNIIKRGEYDIVCPVKIDNNRNKFDNYIPIFNKPQPIVGFNDSTILIRLDKLPFFPFDYIFSPYQWEITALAYDLYKRGLKCILDTQAVTFHHCSKDIQYSPKEREHGSSNWDNKKEVFLNKDNDPDRKLFVDKVVMNSNNANIYGFPCFLGGKL